MRMTQKEATFLSNKNQSTEEKEVMEEKETVTEESAITEEEAKIAELTQSLADVNDKHLRLRAEFDNFRKRTQKEKLEAYGDATAKTVLEILPALDNFERALAAESKDEDFKKGVEMIFNQLCDILKKLGVTEIEAKGAQFNPEYHNAIKQVEIEGEEENTVYEVFQKGYLLGDKVIRHAMVSVANP